MNVFHVRSKNVLVREGRILCIRTDDLSGTSGLFFVRLVSKWQNYDLQLRDGVRPKFLLVFFVCNTLSQILKFIFPKQVDVLNSLPNLS